MLFNLLILFGLSNCEYVLVWADEFDKDGAPDSEFWNFERESYHVNNEKQIYTNHSTNTFIKNSILTIRVLREDYNGYQYTSGRLNTQNKITWTYGRFESRIKLPKGRGTWPAFWMLGANHDTAGWAKCGEIDIMENVGKEPNNIYGTIHYDTGSGHQQAGGQTVVTNPFDDFHIYSIEWDSATIKHFVDGKQFLSTNINGHGDDIFRRPFYVILNFAIGGDWGGDIDTSIIPQDLLIDYVRVYQNK